MKQIRVTLTVQADIAYDEMDDDVYREELDQLILDLEDMGLTVNVESEDSPDEDEEDF